MDKFCYSCAVPLHMPEFQGKAENYCNHCTDEDGELKPRDKIRASMAEWFKTWQPDLNPEEALKRADHYMRAMPAWAE